MCKLARPVVSVFSRVFVTNRGDNQIRSLVLTIQVRQTFSQRLTHRYSILRVASTRQRIQFMLLASYLFTNFVSARFGATGPETMCDAKALVCMTSPAKSLPSFEHLLLNSSPGINVMIKTQQPQFSQSAV